MDARVLVADDDRAIRESLATALELAGYEVTTCADGVQALAATRSTHFEVVILDVMMPGVDGLGVCQVLRAEGNRVPILMITARTETADRVAGLDAGADDYVPKPYDIEEVQARVRALLRRVDTNLPASPSDPSAQDAARASLEVGPVRLDPAARRVWSHGTEVTLSRTEFDLLELLMHNAGIVLEHRVIYDRIWGYDFGPDSKNLAVFIGYLRRKLDVPGDTLIRSVRGVGYTMRED
ncbi:MAG TPA: response regulator transcription factor [Candidatus Nanopelagicales bacterium]